MNAWVTALIVFADGLAVGFAFALTFFLRSEGGFIETPVEFWWPMVFMVAFWWLVFLLRGLYKTPVAMSRFEEALGVFKASLVGTVIIFVLTLDISDPLRITRFFLLNYGFMVFVFVGFERVLLRTIQRFLRSRGIGLWDAVIVGFNDVGRRLHEQLHYFPVWGFRVRGFIDSEQLQGSHLGVNVLGGLDRLADVVKSEKVQWVLVAPQREDHEALLNVFDRCSLLRVRFMVVADYYQMVVGLVRTVEIHGMPLVEVVPRLVPITTRIVKRLMDLTIGAVMFAVLMVLYPLIAIAIKLDSPGPVIYRQRRVGRGGREFNLFKFRSMVQDAEKHSGAVWAAKNDPRVTRIGRILRRTHLDEWPQIFNVLRGDMSLVGPRPERREFVEQFKRHIPLYDRRLRIRPGITGWAQVRHKYDQTIEDVREKTRYDLFYLDHISPALDLKILLATAMRVFSGAGHT